MPVSESVSGLGESPLWDPPAGLRWLDIAGDRLHTIDADGHESSISLSVTATAVELGPGSDLFTVTRTGFGWLDPANGRIAQKVTATEADGVTMNDAAIDPHGRAWAGSAVMDDSRRGALYRLDDRGVTTQLHRLSMSNGIDWSPGGDTLYHVDSTAGTVTAWDYDLGSGELGAARVLRTVPGEIGLPDGLAVDAEGSIWLAIWGPGQVWRLDPRTGDVTATVDVPTPCTTSCTFGGTELSTLYITTANHEQPEGGGLLYAVETPLTGRHTHRFTEAL
ncbi:SMP-30/gluconolactonase/LRE family protein [Prauserella flavalba]|uniref:SMP-30/gluconolactonase/LRE family protein n=1 Tax=Prauserella flavalba TaxID=1477506 RepID=UPI00143D36A2|nr:SMP-30/gluconolactonase/LRE family protein [Prauserella flavalba]